MKRLTLLFLLCILCTSLAGPAAAQPSDDDWFLYLFDSVANDILRVNADGTHEVFPQDLPDNGFIAPGLATINPDGTQIALCVPAADGLTGQLIVRELATDEDVVRATLDELSNCRVTAFTADYVAVSYAGAQSGWGLALYDPATGEAVHTLTSEDEAAPVYDVVGPDVPMIADVRHLTDNEAIFIGLPGVGMGIPGTLPAYRWNWTENTVTEVPAFGSVNGDYLPTTGERAYPALDESRPYAEPTGPLPTANEVRVITDEGETTVYHNPDEVITGVRFVDDGRALVITLLEGAATADPSAPSAMRFVLLDRDGTVSPIGTDYTSFAQAGPVPGGAFILWATETTGAGDPPTSTLDVYRGGTSSEIWTYQPPARDSFSFLQPLWTPPLNPPPDLPPFTVG